MGVVPEEDRNAGISFGTVLDNAERPTGEAVFNEPMQYFLAPFYYPLKQSYRSFSEIVAEKKALAAYADQYYRSLLAFLAPIEAPEGYEAAYAIEMQSGYYETKHQLEKELDSRG